MAIPIKKKAPPVQRVSFGDVHSDIYAQSFDLPEGDYIWADVSAVMHSGFNIEKQGEPRLGVMITLVPKDAPTGEQKQVFYSFGSKAHLSFAPDPNDGKGLVASAGGGTGKLASSTNWMMLLKSLYDAGMPEGTLDNDFSVLDGLWVHMQNVPEPKERAGFQSSTGDSPTEDRKFTRNVAIVGEILEGGMPWDGGGGIPEEEEEKPAKKTVGKPTLAKPAAKLVPKLAPKKAVVVEEEEEVAEEETEEAESTDDEIQTIALGAAATVLEKKPAGLSKAEFVLKVGKAIKAEHGDDVMNTVISTYFEKAAALNSLLGGIDFKVDGPMIKPV